MGTGARRRVGIPWSLMRCPTSAGEVGRVWVVDGSVRLMAIVHFFRVARREDGE